MGYLIDIYVPLQKAKWLAKRKVSNAIKSIEMHLLTKVHELCNWVLPMCGFWAESRNSSIFPVDQVDQTINLTINSRLCIQRVLFRKVKTCALCVSNSCVKTQ